jgi:hypothetical protein
LPLEVIGKFRAELPVWPDRSAKAIVDEIEKTGQLDEAGIATLNASLAALATQISPPLATAAS